MAIVFQNNKYNLTIHSKMIIGVIGEYHDFFASLIGDDIYYIDKNYNNSNKKVYSLLDIDDSKIHDFIKEYDLGEEFLNKKINQLSHSEQKLLKYLLMELNDKKIIIIDEPFMDLDLSNKKKITVLLNKLVKQNKTVIIGSMNSNIIYTLCKRVLFINSKSFYYGTNIDFSNIKLLNKYHVEMPDLVKFIKLASDKKINLKYSSDIRDLIKDVYRNVSQK